MINDHNTDNQVRVADWPFWKGTPLDLIMYAGYLYGRDILMGAPWIAYANSVRLGAGTGLTLTISDVNGLVLYADKQRLPDNQDELIKDITHTIDSLIERMQPSPSATSWMTTCSYVISTWSLRDCIPTKHLDKVATPFAGFESRDSTN